MLIGHQHNIDVFEKMRSKNQVPHSFLLTGSYGVGKKHFALYCAEVLLGGSVEHNPNVVYLNAPTIKEVRALNESVGKTAFFSGNRVVVVDNIHAVSLQATNALLKTIEEPRTQTIFFLIAPNRQCVLQTIQSRCVHLYFGLVPFAEIQQHLDTESIADLQVLWEGRPAVAQDLALNQETRAYAQNILSDVMQFLSASITKRFFIASQYEKEKETLQNFIRTLALVYRKQKNYTALMRVSAMQPNSVALHRFIISYQ